MDADNSDRRDAIRHARRASDALDDAAEALGYDDVHALADAAHNDELDATHREDDAVKAITNAHSYLNNGSLGGLTD